MFSRIRRFFKQNHKLRVVAWLMLIWIVPFYLVLVPMFALQLSGGVRNVILGPLEMRSGGVEIEWQMLLTLAGLIYFALLALLVPALLDKEGRVLARKVSMYLIWGAVTLAWIGTGLLRWIAEWGV